MVRKRLRCLPYFNVHEGQWISLLLLHSTLIPFVDVLVLVFLVPLSPIVFSMTKFASENRCDSA
jgi:hypothetical protein